MADHLTALHHHDKAKAALERGDTKKAAHHLGHAMNALKSSKSKGANDMPVVSKAQFRAMQAAAHGKSTKGIPASVGKEFVAETPSPKSLPDHVTRIRKALKK